MSDSYLTPTAASPFHRGEQRIQQRLGLRDKLESLGRRVIHDYLPEQHREFYHRLPFVFVAHADREGRPWASMLVAREGFMTSPDDKHLSINTAPPAGDPLADALYEGNRLGLLGIELSSRRRNRLAGRIERVSAAGFQLAVDQAFGNCPQYIQARACEPASPGSLPKPSVIELHRLDSEAQALIAGSDTCFVASFAADGSGRAYEGADMSHRGGMPGFIRVDNDRCLTIPDYRGNNHFNTLGNFSENPRAGMLFIDFAGGHLLTLTGAVEILWDSPETALFPGALRLWTFRLERGRWLKNALPMKWSAPDYSPATLRTGS